MAKAKVIFFDMDGTLLNNQALLSSFSIDNLRLLHSKGLILGIASGRPISAIEKKLASFGLHDCFSLVVGMNGSHIKNLDTGMFEEVLTMPSEGIKQFLDLYADLPVERMLCDEQAVYMERESVFAQAISQGDYLRLVITDFSEERKKSWPKAGIYYLDEYRQAVLERYHNNFHYPLMAGKIAGRYSLEFTHSATDKGIGIHYLVGKLHIPLEQVMAFGDTENDSEMLKVVGKAVAMKNGTQFAKQQAQYITKYTNEEDGAVRFLMDNSELLELPEVE